jgi:hypothetical protein
MPPIIVAGLLGHSLAILRPAFARFARYARDIPGTQDEPLGFASLASAAQPARKSSSLGFAAQYAALPARKSSSLGFAAQYAAQPARKSSSLGFAAQYAAQLMNEILTQIPIDLRGLKREKS